MFQSGGRQARVSLNLRPCSCLVPDWPGWGSGDGSSQKSNSRKDSEREGQSSEVGGLAFLFWRGCR